jgi:26S proteasome regulatory subunit T2
LDVDQAEENPEFKQIESLRGTPNLVGVLEELVDENHGIVSS